MSDKYLQLRDEYTQYVPRWDGDAILLRHRDGGPVIVDIAVVRNVFAELTARAIVNDITDLERFALLMLRVHYVQGYYLAYREVGDNQAK